MLDECGNEVCIVSYKVLHDTTSRYLGPLTHVADRRALRLELSYIHKPAVPE